MAKINRFNHPPFFTNIERVLFLLTIVLLPTQIGKHFWPPFAHIYSIRTDYFSPVIFVWDILVVALVLVALLRGMRFRFGATALLIFLSTQLGSFFVSNNLGSSLVRFEQYALVGTWGVYLANNRLVNFKELLWKGLGIALLWSSVLGVMQFLMGKTLGFWFLGERSFNLDTISIATFDWYDQVFLRPYSTFPHPNVFAAFLLIGILIFEYLRNSRVKFSTFFYGLVIILSSVALFLTFSRVVAGLYSIVLLYFLRKRLKWLLIIFLLLLPFLYVRFHSAFNFDQLSLIRREELAVAAFELWHNSPIFGVGLNNFIYELAEGSIVSGEVRFLQPVHMIFLLTLAETGVIGFFGLAAIFYAPMLLMRNIIRSKFKRHDLIILVYGWICVVVMGLFDHFFLTLAQGLRIFFLLWGFTMLQYVSADFEKDRKSNKLPINR